MSELLLLAPMGIEARVLRAGAPHVNVVATGVGARRARRAAAMLACAAADGVAVAGFAGALSDRFAPGDLVVASELLTRDGNVVAECPGASVIAGMLRRHGVPAHVGPIVSVARPVAGGRRAALARGGALVSDMESAWLAPAAAGRPFAVLRAVLDTPSHELWNPLALARSVAPAWRGLRTAASVLAEWAPTIAPRELVRAAPRASCAGVERAIEVVERVLDRYGAPVYMRKQIVHNRHVVEELERRGAICVEDLDEVPDGATVIFSAHGVSPQIREEADRRRLNVIDATCPLVSKVHGEARRFADAGYTIVLIGHEGHDEVQGTIGEVPDRISVIASSEQVDRLTVPDPSRLAYLTQTTLAVDETRDIVGRLRERFPEVVGPRSDDICYATQNRQDAVKLLATSCDLMLIVGSRNSSNSNRLVEVAELQGCPARLLDDETQIDPSWLAGVHRVGVSAGASTPERIVKRIERALTVLGPIEARTQAVANETVRFALPREVRD